MNPHNFRIFVYTEREGMLGAIGHDLKLAVNRFEIDETDDGFAVSVEADSITVAGCIVNGREESVSDKDRKTIEKNINKDVLKTKQHKYIDFEGTAEFTGEDAGKVRGMLRLCGREGEIEVDVTRDGDTFRGEAVIDQRDYGIKPFTAFLGQLRIKPEVRVEVLADVD